MAEVIDQPFDAHARHGWYPDPTGRNDLRYWDGRGWTPDVRNHGRDGRDGALGAPCFPLVRMLGLLCAVAALAGAVLLLTAPVTRYAGVVYDPEGNSLSATCATIASASQWLVSPGVLVGILAIVLAQAVGWSTLLRVGSAHRDRQIAGLTLAISLVAVVIGGCGLDRAISLGCHEL